MSPCASCHAFGVMVMLEGLEALQDGCPILGMNAMGEQAVRSGWVLPIESPRVH